MSKARTIKLATVALLCIGGAALAEETTVEVPQGSPVFPTIGQVNCLEEVGGRYCAATYECADGTSGRLWGDMAANDGQQAIRTNSPVATRRGCTVTVDGTASVKWFTGYRHGSLFGVAPHTEATRPVIRREVSVVGGSDGLWLPWFQAEYDIPDVKAAMLDDECGHIRDGTVELKDCERGVLQNISWTYARGFLWASTPVTRCATELVEAYREKHAAREGAHYRWRQRTLTLNGTHGCRMTGEIDAVTCAIPTLIEDAELPGRNALYDDDLRDKYRECRALVEEQANELGIELPTSE